MSLTDTTLLAALQAVTDPNTGKDFVTTKAIQNLQIQGGDVSFDLEMGYPARSQHPALRQALITAAKGVPGVGNVSVNISTRVIAHAAQRGVQVVPDGALARAPVAGPGAHRGRELIAAVDQTQQTVLHASAQRARFRPAGDHLLVAGDALAAVQG
ncbi:MAG: DUF59 domain-containing protein, partial [Betaproteobacteria bacterium]|nr:DUF59 domain-containing protein [Betaproteobacteria bacterium]